MRAVIQYFHRFITGERSGTALIEGAIIFPFLFMCLFGLVEITTLISVKERINKVANQVAIVVSALPSWDDRGEIPAILAATDKIGGLHGFNVSVALCGNASGQKGAYKHGYNGGSCGYGEGGGGGKAVASCAGVDGNVGRGQYMVVAVGCKYHPMFSYLDFLSDGGNVKAESFAPMRYVMNW